MKLISLLSVLLTSAFGQLSFDAGITFNAYFNSTLQLVVYTVVVPKNMYFAIGYGWNMDDTNMVIWQATGTQSSNTQGDYWSRGENTPTKLTTGNMYTTTNVVDARGVTTFTTTRTLDADRTTKNFVITPDKDQEMCFAFNPQTSAIKNHEQNRGVFTMRLNQDGSSLVALRQVPSWELHGWILWTCWTLGSLILICSNRYWKVWYSGHQWVHSITAYLIGIGTLYGVYKAWVLRKKRIVIQYHPICGLATFFIAIIVIGLGMFAMVRRKFVTKDWQTSNGVWWAKLHSYVAYFLIFLSQVTVTLGIVIYWKGTLQTALGIGLAVLNFIGFWGILAFSEIMHRKNLKREEPFNKVQVSMSEREFNMLVGQGRKLVILDEFVLDVANYISWHPGGKFLLTHNIGRDISKFFHGGYSLEGNLGPAPAAGYAHSNVARQVVNKLIIAQFQKEIEVQSTICRMVHKDDFKVNNSTKVLFLQSFDGEKVPNFKKFYPGLSSVGKHFLVRNLNSDRAKVARHYTVCNVMRPEVYTNLIAMLQEGTNDGQIVQLLSTDNQDRIALTIKNYKQVTGLSCKFFDPLETQFEVKGPMGKPLGIEPKGIYVCFAGGTGLLPFMDLVAQLAYANLGLCQQLGQSNADSINPQAFKLRLYVSFQSREESIGMELLLALEAYCKKKGIKNFELFQRFSKEKVNPERWNNQFIERELSKDFTEIKKVLVCGPPVMNETFDRALSSKISQDVRSSIVNALTFRKEQIEIL